MIKKSFTLFLSTNGKTGSFKEFHISPLQFRYGVIGIVICTLFLGIVSADYLFSFSSHFKSQKYKQENAILKSQLAQIYTKMKQIDSRLSQIKDFSHKIKGIAGITQNNSVPLGPLESVSFPVGVGVVNNKNNQQEDFKSLDTQNISASDSIYKVIIYMDNLDKKSKLVHQDTTLLVEQLYSKQDALSNTPSLLPAKGWISSKFGYRKYPFTGEVTLHEGIDIAAYPGTPIYAPSNGVVIFAGYKPSYGKVLVIDHGYELTTLYGHLSDIMVVEWQNLKRGQVIGTIGNTGNSSGPHLHYEVRISNVPVDPANYIIDSL